MSTETEDPQSWPEICREVAKWMGQHESMVTHSTAYMDIMKAKHYYAEGDYVWPAYHKDNGSFAELMLSIPGSITITPDGVEVTAIGGPLGSPVKISKDHRNRRKAAVIVAKLISDRGLEPNRLDAQCGAEVVASDYEGKQIRVGDRVLNRKHPSMAPVEVIGIRKVLRGETIRFASGGGHATSFERVEERNE